MNCLTHVETAALGICVHCGRGLCGVCEERSANGRMVCSEGCAAASERFDHTVDTAVRSNRKAFLASAYSCYGAAAFFGLVSLFFLFVGLWPITLPVAGGVVLMALIGVYFHRNAPAEMGSRRREEPGDDPADVRSRGW